MSMKKAILAALVALVAFAWGFMVMFSTLDLMRAFEPEPEPKEVYEVPTIIEDSAGVRM